MISPLFTVVTCVSHLISANSTFWYRNTFSVLHHLSGSTEASFGVVVNIKSFVSLVVAAALADAGSTCLVFHISSTSGEWTEVGSSPTDTLAGSSASLSVTCEDGTSWPVAGDLVGVDTDW